MNNLKIESSKNWDSRFHIACIMWNRHPLCLLFVNWYAMVGSVLQQIESAVNHLWGRDQLGRSFWESATTWNMRVNKWRDIEESLFQITITKMVITIAHSTVAQQLAS